MSNQLMHIDRLHVSEKLHEGQVILADKAEQFGTAITTGIDRMIPRPETHAGKFALATLPYFLLYAIAVVLIAMTDHDPASAQGAWDYFIPLVAIVSTLSGWDRHAGAIWQERARYVLKQTAHWGSLLIVIHLLFQSDVQHFLRAETDGFVIVYILGLASILSGIYLDWKMAVFGLFLIFSGVVIAFLDDNALLIAIGGTATLAVIGTAFAWIKHHQHSESQGA
ncbi:hypothetical protein [Imhoffiella purpurea]|uniref:Uncharacterized protein n=1 Tax=Imhoffiella purpurea TaxID=1249627 RepID=W9VEH1_9GAMM|nr:hypothetical protein [Imhoffiella purpurea]EXJ15376.1 hypothetical protein D779_1472 [Imhoffiella purpurea]